MTKDEIHDVNDCISRNELIYYTGKLVNRKFGSGLISTTGKFAYIVEDGIAVLLQGLAVVLQKDRFFSENQKNIHKEEKKDVQNFYDKIGWLKDEEGTFEDAKKFEDLRPVSKEYIHKCHMRVNDYLKDSGKYILDAASGPIQYPEYLSYSKNYAYRICVDISFLALREAKKKLGDKGIYIMADITKLPIESNIVDAVVSLHTIYHVPADEQAKAFSELYRVLKPGSTGVVVYSWSNHSLLMKAMLFPIYAPIIAIRMAKKVIGSFFAGEDKPSQRPPETKLYFHVHPYKWFDKEIRRLFDFEIVVWRSVNVPFLKLYIHKWLFGKQLLSFIYWLEEKFLHFLGRFGAYPMIIIYK
jgi:SAM-dependent methyltransferase